MSGDWKGRGGSTGPKTSRSSCAVSPRTSECVRGENNKNTQRTDPQELEELAGRQPPPLCLGPPFLIPCLGTFLLQGGAMLRSQFAEVSMPDNGLHMHGDT